VQSTPRASITHTIDVWALVEIVSSILAVCLPSLRIFVRKHGFRRSDGAVKLVNSANGSSGHHFIGSSITHELSEKRSSVQGRETSPVRDEEDMFVTMPEQVHPVQHL